MVRMTEPVPEALRLFQRRVAGSASAIWKRKARRSGHVEISSRPVCGRVRPFSSVKTRASQATRWKLGPASTKRTGWWKGSSVFREPVHMKRRPSAVTEHSHVPETGRTAAVSKRSSSRPYWKQRISVAGFGCWKARGAASAHVSWQRSSGPGIQSAGPAMAEATRKAKAVSQP